MVLTVPLVDKVLALLPVLILAWASVVVSPGIANTKPVPSVVPALESVRYPDSLVPP